MLEVFGREGPARMGFQVLFEHGRLLARAKCDGRFYSPGQKLRRVSDLTAVVLLEAILKVIRQPRIVTSFVTFAHKNVNVVGVSHEVRSL
jgi:hypothetical protein